MIGGKSQGNLGEPQGQSKVIFKRSCFAGARKGLYQGRCFKRIFVFSDFLLYVCFFFRVLYYSKIWSHWSRGVAYGVWDQGPYHVWTACGAHHVSHTFSTPTAGFTRINSIEHCSCNNVVGARKKNIGVVPMCLRAGMCGQRFARSWNVQHQTDSAPNALFLQATM